MLDKVGRLGAEEGALRLVMEIKFYIFISIFVFVFY